MLLWALDREIGSLPPALGALLLVLLSVWTGVRSFAGSVVVWVALFFMGLALQSQLMVSRAVVTGLGTSWIDARMRVTAPLRYGIPGSARAEVETMLNGERLRGIVSLPDLPWESLSIATDSYLVGHLRLLRLHQPRRAKFHWPDRDARHGIAFRGAVTEISQVKGANEAHPLRLRLSEQLIGELGYSRALAVIISSSTGFGSLLDDLTVELFKRTGLYHVLVVSGSHVSFVYAVIQLSVLWMLSRSWFLLTLLRIKFASLLCGFLGAAAFVAFTGAEPPSVRALVALSVFVLAEALFRHSQKVESYLYVVAAMLIVFPGCFLDAGPVLTFSAVLGLYVGFDLCRRGGDDISFRESRSEQWSWLRRGRAALYRGLVVSVTVWFFTTPWLILFFERISPLSALFNLLFGGIFSGVVCIGGLLVVAMFLLGLPSFYLFKLLCSFTDLILWAIELADGFASSLGLGEVSLGGNMRPMVVTAFLLLNLLLVGFRGRRYLMLRSYCVPA